MNTKKRSVCNRISLALLGALTVLLLASCGDAKSMGGDTAGGDYLLTVDGYGVTEEEFRLFLLDKKAVTANYYWTNYQIQPDADFWTTEVDGKTPLDYAKERALNALVKSKIEFILASERNILAYQDYNARLKEMEAENAERARKQEAGEVFYGLTEFTPFTYYQYLNTNIRSELEYSQLELAKPSDDALRRLYEENQESFSLGVVYEYEIVYADGERETVTQHSHEVGKADTTTEDLIYQFETMEAGDMISGYGYRGEPADIVLLGKTAQGYLSFEEAKESLQTLYAREELSALIQSRAETAKVEIDRSRYDAIQMQ